MSRIRTEKHYEAQNSRISVDFITDRGQYHAAHYADGLEMIYLLNGNARLTFDGRPINLVQGEFIVIDRSHIYELSCKEQFMEIRIRVDRDFISGKAALPLQEGQIGWKYQCLRDELTHEKLEPYLAMCDLFKNLVPLYINEPSGYRLKTESTVLDILFLLVQYFAVPLFENEARPGGGSPERIRIEEILSYIEERYAEDISLSRIAGHFGLTREYFSRLFHKGTGITFSNHLQRVRIAHFYYDLVNTDVPVMELLEKHGIRNYKIFSRTFKELYGCTPREARKF